MIVVNISVPKMMVWEIVKVIPMKYGSLPFFNDPFSMRPEQPRHQEDSLSTTSFGNIAFNQRENVDTLGLEVP